MTEIEEYNADAKKLMEALIDVDSDFTWRIRTWGMEMEMEASLPWSDEQVQEWKGYTDDPVPTPEERRESAMQRIFLRAKTKNEYYNKGKLVIFQEVSRQLLEDIDVTIPLIIGMVKEELERALADYVASEFQRQVKGEGSGDPVGIIAATD